MQKALSEPPVLNWDSVIHKVARTKDGDPAGYIAADDEKSIYILSSRFREYRVPKRQVLAFDGSAVLINLESGELSRYQIQ